MRNRDALDNLRQRDFRTDLDKHLAAAGTPSRLADLYNVL
jgi:hypothetical protein